MWVHRVVHAARGGGERGQIVLAMTLMDDLASAPQNAGPKVAAQRALWEQAADRGDGLHC